MICVVVVRDERNLTVENEKKENYAKGRAAYLLSPH